MKHPFVGLFVHRVREDRRGRDEVNWQGLIVAVDNGTAEIQLFSWATGYPTDVESVPVSELSGAWWRFYPDEDSWRQAAAESSERAQW